MRVVDEDLVKYLHHVKSYGKWPVVGVSIFPGFALPPSIQRLFANALEFVR